MSVRRAASRFAILSFLKVLVATLLLAGCATLPQGPAGPPSVLRATLDNGLQVIIVRDPLAPIVTQQLTFFAGANQSPAGFPGMAHAQEHMMFRGSPGLTGNQISDITAQLGGDSNAFTTPTTTTYYFTVPADDLDLTLQVDAIRLAGVDDVQAEWERERGAIEQEVAQDNSNPLYVLESRARERIFAGTPYVDTGLGTKDSFDKTTGDMLKAFASAWYAPNNALLVLAGDVDPQALLARVRQLYGGIPRRALPARPSIQFQEVTPETFSSTTDQPYGIVAYVFRMPGYRSPGYPAARILSGVLDSPRGAISALSFEGKALGSGFVQQTLTDAGFAIAYAAFPAGADDKALAQQLKDAITQASSRIPADLIEAQRRQVLLDSALRADSVSGLAQAWTDAVAVKGLDSPDQEVSLLRAVDAKAVSAAAPRLLDFSHAITLVLTPSGGQGAGGGGQVFGSAESFGATPQGPVELPAWAAAALAKLPHPTALFTPTVYDLPNGLRLIVQRLATSGAVSLYGRVHTDESLQAPQGQDGVGDMLNTLFDWGPTGMSRSDFEAAMDSIGANYSTGTSFSLQTLPESFDRGVELLAKDLLDPALPPDAFASQKPIQARQAASNAQSPVFQFRLAVQKGLVPAGDPSLRRPTAQTIGALTLDAVRAYNKTVMRPDQTTIVVVGNMDSAAVRTIIEARFGAWKAVGPKPNLDLAPVPPSAASNAFVADSVREQNQVVLAETLPLTYGDADHYAVALGNIFLGGDSFANPLYRELRVRRGLVYSVGSSAGFGKTRGSFSIDYGASPGKVLEAKQLAIQTVQAMADQPLSDQDLHLAKGQALRQIELTNQNASDIADNWLGYSEEGLSLNRLFEVAGHYEAITAADIQAAFKKYLDVGRLSTFILGKPVD